VSAQCPTLLHTKTSTPILHNLTLVELVLDPKTKQSIQMFWHTARQSNSHPNYIWQCTKLYPVRFSTL